MSTRLRSRPRPSPSRRPRIGPPDAAHLVREFDRPPDGWRRVSTSPVSRLVERADAGTLRAAMRLATRIGRRDFIRRASGIAAAAGLGLTSFVWGAPNAIADGTSACGPNEWGCGSSPICPDSVCASDPDGPGMNCDPNCGCGGVWKRVQTMTQSWSDGAGVTDCASFSASNCWREDCCSTANHNRRVRCCDCCVPPQFTGGLDCTCSSTKRRCICRSVLATC
jgi:hypothetical protein